uniref:Carboxylic ester hydrolase n=1 Tax=Leptinotarsa decemlineata TaxID=7539 RepID=A0A0A7ENJ5_LEPDE|nr:putative beta-esterase [Leptinotarsa decemlineata]
MKVELLLLLLIVFLNVSADSLHHPIVTLSEGDVEGFIEHTVKGRSFYAFKGIPYARPPIGDLRFQESVPPEPWKGVWQAITKFKCMQYDHFTPPGSDMVSGDEDCLYLNVYTPSLKHSEALDVLVYIHGGAFMFNYGALYGPQIILDRDVVYVSINYRLGPLGFLSTEDSVVSGNNGMKDQILALKWVKSHIKNFGGNPNSVTISGMSAGGASVQLHYLSPKSKDLFSKGISQSGVALNPWVLVENPLQRSKKLSSIVGCPVENNSEMVSCLKTKPGRQITQAVKYFQPWLYNPFSPFGVVVDKNWANDPFLEDHPYILLKNGYVQDLPWITPYVSSEGLYPGSDFYSEEHMEYLNQNWNEIIPYILHYDDVVPSNLKDSISEKIKSEYLQSGNVTKDSFHMLVQMLSDRLFIADIEKSGRLHSAAVKSSVYSYYFDYRGSHSKSEFRTHNDVNLGTSHGDDTSYILKTNLDTLSNEDDRMMSNIMVDMFTSFMKTGKPNISSEWIPLSKKTSDRWRQLHVTSPYKIYAEEQTELGNQKFWNKLPFQENEKLFNQKDEL